MNKIKTEELNDKNDVIFKCIMLDHPNILKEILVCLMQKEIHKFRILNSELTKTQFIEKGKRLDAYLCIEDEYVDIEVSTEYSKSIDNRNLSYICHIFCTAVKMGQDYTNYKKATIYNLIWNEKSSYLYRNGILTDQYGNIVNDMLNFNNVYMDKFMENYYNKNIKFIKTYKYLIMLGLTVEQLNELIVLTEGDEIVKEYQKALEEIINNDEIAPFISKEEDERMIRDALKYDSRLEGLEQGLEQGIEHEKRETIQKLLSKNFTINQIADMLDLDVIEINHLIDEQSI